MNNLLPRFNQNILKYRHSLPDATTLDTNCSPATEVISVDLKFHLKCNVTLNYQTQHRNINKKLLKNKFLIL